ncbi:hypothetical protein RJT34_16498 [Clitoria ternatea]|uniref:Uncharacterized protein n=1 Tax=Clitoria ternatea TaxID=43366 RepID=A0AAN9PDQ9_CLITE
MRNLHLRRDYKLCGGRNLHLLGDGNLRLRGKTVRAMWGRDGEEETVRKGNVGCWITPIATNKILVANVTTISTLCCGRYVPLPYIFLVSLHDFVSARV